MHSCNVQSSIMHTYIQGFIRIVQGLCVMRLVNVAGGWALPNKQDEHEDIKGARASSCTVRVFETWVSLGLESPSN